MVEVFSVLHGCTHTSDVVIIQREITFTVVVSNENEANTQRNRAVKVQTWHDFKTVTYISVTNVNYCSVKYLLLLDLAAN